MKSIIFFDAKDYEIDYFKSHLGKKFELLFETDSLNSEIKIPAIAMNVELISVFTSSKLTKEVLKQFKNLRLIATRSVGFSHIDMAYCKEHNIKVVNTPHYGDYTVAEYSFGLLLDLVRKIDESKSDLKSGIIDSSYKGMELHGKTIGIVGTGRIGSKAVKIANGFSMNVIAYDIQKNIELEKTETFQYVDFEDLIEKSDIISFYLPANEKNHHLIRREEIEKMKTGVFIVNTARGELIDSEALFDGLIEKKIGGAALDVLECEEALTKGCKNFQNGICTDFVCLKKSLINHKLLTFKNVIVTPHVAYDTQEAVNRIMEITANNIIAFSINDNIENGVL